MKTIQFTVFSFLLLSVSNGRSCASEMLIIQPDAKVQRLTAAVKIGKPGQFKNPRTNEILAWFAFNPHRYTNDLLPAMTMASDGTVETKGRNLSLVRGTWVLGASFKPASNEKELRYAKALLLSGLPTPEFSKELGQPLEIIPITDPFSPADTAFKFKVYFQTKPLANGKVVLIPEGKSPALEIKLDEMGTATVNLPKVGNYLLFVEHLDDSVSMHLNATLNFPWNPNFTK